MNEMDRLKLDAVTKEELLRALIYMTGEYLGSEDAKDEIQHSFMSAGEYTCKILSKVGAIEPHGWGGRWLIDSWWDI